MPVRVASIHQCFKNTPVYQLIRAINVLMMQGADNKMRLLTHLGDDCEIRYKLLGFGIPVDRKLCCSQRPSLFWLQTHSHCFMILHTVLPFTDSNNIKNKNFNSWIKARKVIEQIEEQKRKLNDVSPLHLVECPALPDVVFKTGSSNLSHPGNTIFRELLYAHYDSYYNPKTPASKQDAVTLIIQDITSRGGTFLEWSNDCNCWVVMQDPATIRTKVYNSLFYFKKTFNAKKKMQVNLSSTYMFERQDGRKRKRESDGSEAPMCARNCTFW